MEPTGVGVEAPEGVVPPYFSARSRQPPFAIRSHVFNREDGCRRWFGERREGVHVPLGGRGLEEVSEACRISQVIQGPFLAVCPTLAPVNARNAKK
jgi:hypothetical protein